MQGKIPLISIVGQTATGKSSCARMIADRIGGVIINADARQIYRGLPIITAIPENLTGAHLYGFKDNSEPYSCAEFVRDADKLVQNTWKHDKKISILVGGTGLYMDAFINRTSLPPKVDPEIRAAVTKMGEQKAYELLKTNDPQGFAAIDAQNPRRVQRAVEIFLQTGKSVVDFHRVQGESPYVYLKIGLKKSNVDLREQITARVFEMWKRGAVDEVRLALAAGHTIEEPGMQSIGVYEIAEFLSGDSSETEAQERIILRTMQYAKRQMTWFKKDATIQWYTNFDELWHSVQNFLQQNSREF